MPKTKGKPRREQHVCEMVGVPGEGLFIVHDGVRIATRGPNKTWISLEPGWSVRDIGDYEGIEVEFNGTRVH